jgi:L-amino acid N-acyltransferase YncA
MKLRLATLADLDSMAAMGESMHAESTYAELHYSRDRVKEVLGALIDKSQFVIVAEDTNGALVAAMAGSVSTCWFGDDAVASDLALFIAPAHRGGMLVVRMVKAFVQWAQMAGAKQIRPGVTTGSEVAERIYSHLGFERCGASFVLRGN